jgi:zinc protease
MSSTSRPSLELAAAVVGLALSLSAWAGPKIQSWPTANGAQVLFVEAPELPMLDVRVVFNAGSARDANPGVASLTNALLDEGAGEWDADQIADRIEGVGGALESGSLRDMAWVSLRTLTSEPALSTSLETLSRILAQPRFPQPALERLRKATLVALNQDEQDPGSVGKKALYRSLFGGHPYAEDPLGTQDTVPGIDRDDILAHYRRYYVAANATIAMVGAVTRNQAERIADQVASGLAAGSAAPPLAPVSEPAAAQNTHVDFPSTQSHVYAGFPGMRRGDPDYFPLYVGNHVLGGNGLVSLLSEEVREKRGLSYSVYSYFLPMQQRGPFMLGLQTKSEQVEQAREVLMSTLARFIEEGPDAAELEAAKQNITGGFPLRIASNSKIVEYLSVIGFYDLPLDYLDRFNANVEAVTGEQIRDAFRRRIDLERFSVVVVGPPEVPHMAANAGRAEASPTTALP